MKLLDRIIDHLVDRVMARAEHNRSKGPTFTVGDNASMRAGIASAMAIADGIVAGGLPAKNGDPHAEHENRVHINGASHAAKQAAAEFEHAMQQHRGRTA